VQDARYIHQKAGWIFVSILQHGVKNVILDTTKAPFCVYRNEVKKIMFRRKYHTLKSFQYNYFSFIISRQRATTNMRQNAAYQHDTTVVQISVIAYSSVLLVHFERRRGAGVCVYHMAPALFPEYKNLRLLS